jgi:hypothetical protein
VPGRNRGSYQEDRKWLDLRLGNWNGCAVKLALAFCAIAVFAFSSCDGGDKTRTYPTDVRENFLSSCEGGGGSPSECKCMLDEIQKRMDLDEFTRFEERYGANGDLPDEIADAAAECKLPPVD